MNTSLIVVMLLKEEADVHIIRWPINDEAPFQFDFFGLNVFKKMISQQNTTY